MTKGRKIESLATVTGKGINMRSGTCSIETPYVDFTVEGRRLRWHSDNATTAHDELPIGASVALCGFTYDETYLRRVTVSWGCRTYGMGA